MPELPEVETIKEGLKKICVNAAIVYSELHTVKLRKKIPENLPDFLKNNIIHAVERRAKYLILRFNRGSLLIHFGMTGRINIAKNYQKSPHEHLTLYLDNGFILSFCDPRRFGSITWAVDNIDEDLLFINCGLEPFSPKFTADYLYEKSKRRQVAIKNFLMDNKVVVGIGNIYASEILFRAQIHPQRKTNTISKNDAKRIYAAVILILNNAIRAGGTTIRDFRDHQGKLGYFAQELLVYGKENENCMRCGDETQILRSVINGRSSYYCSICQI